MAVDFFAGSKNSAPRAQMPQISPPTVQSNLLLPAVIGDDAAENRVENMDERDGGP